MADALTAAISRLGLDDPAEAHEQVLQKAQAILKKSKADSQAQHAALVALVKLDRYDDALHLLNAAGSSLKSQAALEHAYVLYKTGQPREALKIAQSNAKSRDFQHLLAQAAYRSEEFELARNTCATLQAEGSEEDNDLRVNRGAIDAALTWTGKSSVVGEKKIERHVFEQYDTAFNAGSEAAAKGDLKQALMFLKKARDLCAATDLNDDEREEELVPINVQILYVLHQLGKQEEAEALAGQISLDAINDPTLKHIAQASLLAISPPTNPYTSHNLFNSTASSVVVSNRPFSYQSSALKRNAYTHSLKAHKAPGVAASTLSILKSHAEDPSHTSAIHAGAYNALSHIDLSSLSNPSYLKQALSRLSTLRANRPNDIGLLLATAQLYIQSSNLPAATQLLESHIASASSVPPALTAILVALYEAQSRYGPAKEALRAAAAKNQQSAQPDPQLLAAAGTALLFEANDEDLETAQKLFTSLPPSNLSRAGILASAPSLAALESSSADFSSLPSLSRLLADMDIDALEEAGVPTLPRAPTLNKKRAAQVTAPGLNPDGTKKTKRRRIRKSRMPKDFVEGKELDPERWLPLRERSGYRAKKRKGRGAGNAQGASQGAGDEGGGPAVQKGGQVVQGKSGGGGGGKKKKKGKR